jgi:hypothetical protein
MEPFGRYGVPNPSIAALDEKRLFVALVPDVRNQVDKWPGPQLGAGGCQGLGGRPEASRQHEHSVPEAVDRTPLELEGRASHPGRAGRAHRGHDPVVLVSEYLDQPELEVVERLADIGVATASTRHGRGTAW